MHWVAPDRAPPVKFPDLLNRNSRRGLLIEINPYQILAAGITHLDESPAVLDCTAEFDREDDAGLRLWLDNNFDKQKGWVPVICGFSAPESLLHRESILPRKLADPAYLPDLVKEQYKIENPTVWKLQTLSPLEGVPLLPEGTQRPALVCGVSHTEVQQTQQRLLDQRLLPYRLEQSILPLLGSISDFKARRNDKRAIVVVNIEQEHTVAYIVGKEACTPRPPCAMASRPSFRRRARNSSSPMRPPCATGSIRPTRNCCSAPRSLSAPSAATSSPSSIPTR